MATQASEQLVDGAHCRVVGGSHAGKSGTVRDIHTSKSGHVTVTVEPDDSPRFKTLARHVVVEARE